MALLAKQEWRIILGPNSLIARILKVKYHHSISFMEAQIGVCLFGVGRVSYKAEKFFLKVFGGMSAKAILS